MNALVLLLAAGYAQSPTSFITERKISLIEYLLY